MLKKCNNAYHSTIKVKPVDVKPSPYIDSSKEINYQDPYLKLVMLLEYQNIKIFLQKAMFPIGLKKFLWLKKLKPLFHGHILLVILKVKKLLERLMKNNCKNTN